MPIETPQFPKVKRMTSFLLLKLLDYAPSNGILSWRKASGVLGSYRLTKKEGRALIRYWASRGMVETSPRGVRFLDVRGGAK